MGEFIAAGILPTTTVRGEIEAHADRPYEHAVIRYTDQDGQGRRRHRFVAQAYRFEGDTDDTLMARARAMAAALTDDVMPDAGPDAEPEP